MENEDTKNNIYSDESWSWFFLRTEFRKKDLESLFNLYVQKIQHGYFSLFLILQVILSTSHIAILLLTNMKYFEAIFPDIVCYCVIAVLSLIALFLKETIGKTCAIFPLGITVFTILVLVTCDLFVPLYHSSYSLLRPAYTTHVIMACYVFLPIPDNLQAFVFGFAVTLCHLIMLALVTYRKSTSDFAYRLGCDTIYMLCINGIGLYFRYMNEILKRRTFMDRRACIQSTLHLKHEKDQEEQLMLSILPQHIANKVHEDIKNALQNLKNNVIPEYKLFRELYIKKHDDVTILYADIVRYTEMTRTLPVIELVKTLNELFSQFDDASENHNVLRIKFLGDCYCCVSGVPDSNPNHAISCVNLGLDMIAIIQEVRRKRNLNIDMRIGVHSGSIFGGIIGECKWQYDIWSKDVDITNRMEQRGKPGKVHITKQTLDLLQNKYNYITSDAASEDEFLSKLKIETFLISPDEETPRFSSSRMSSTSNIYHRWQNMNLNRTDNRYVTARNHSTDSYTVMSHRRTAFMNHNIKQYNLRMKAIDNELEKSVNSMPLRKFEQWFKSPIINPFFLTFQNWKMEFPYFVLPDPMFKYYLISSFAILFAILGIQILSSLQFDLSIWLICITLIILLVILMPLAWVHTFMKRVVYSRKLFQIKHFCCDIFKSSSALITNNVAVRIIIYFIVSGLIAACTVLDLVECEDYFHDNNITTINKNELYCAIPWHLTQTCSLAIFASFLFLRIHLGLKLLVGSAITLIFSYLIFNVKLIDEETWNRELKPQIACIMSITFLTFTLHLIDRQAEYLNRLDYQWQHQLTLDQKEAQNRHLINNMLLLNILPGHVAEKYLDTNRKIDELYHEQYKSVAVMFASVVGYEFNEDEIDSGVETSTFVIMNDIISEFDKLLIKPCGQKIEKIKVAGWTYMAACGLNPGRKDSTNSINQQLGKNIVLQLVTFGINMMKVLDEINGQYSCEFKLRIGISHGEVTAGVIGSKKPLYDIWGNAVNMASRMDSTGEKGKIQVTENTAQVLIKQNIKCTYRGDTYIKGLDTEIPTFYVCLDSKALDLNNDR